VLKVLVLKHFSVKNISVKCFFFENLRILKMTCAKKVKNKNRNMLKNLENQNFIFFIFGK